MFEKLRIKNHMEIADSEGRPVGIVDELAGDRIKLTRSPEGETNHFLDVSQVDRIEGNKIFLKVGTPIPIRIE